MMVSWAVAPRASRGGMKAAAARPKVTVRRRSSIIGTFQAGRCSSTHRRRPAMLALMNRLEPMALGSDVQSRTSSLRDGRIGVLIANLGTPDATDPASVRRYLREFLSDARVIENQGLIWKFVLNAAILPRRPRAKGRDYEKIWNRERNESPLKTITRSQAEKLRATLDAIDPAIMVDWGMRYGNPS